MPRVIVATTAGRPMLNERVSSEMLADDHYADQLTERMGWALHDAEEVEAVEEIPSPEYVPAARAARVAVMA